MQLSILISRLTYFKRCARFHNALAVNVHTEQRSPLQSDFTSKFTPIRWQLPHFGSFPTFLHRSLSNCKIKAAQSLVLCSHRDAACALCVFAVVPIYVSCTVCGCRSLCCLCDCSQHRVTQEKLFVSSLGVLWDFCIALQIAGRKHLNNE